MTTDHYVKRNWKKVQFIYDKEGKVPSVLLSDWDKSLKVQTGTPDNPTSYLSLLVFF